MFGFEKISFYNAYKMFLRLSSEFPLIYNESLMKRLLYLFNTQALSLNKVKTFNDHKNVANSRSFHRFVEIDMTC